MFPSRDPAARTAGWLLLVTAIATVVSVIGRVAATDLTAISQSLTAIAANREQFGIGGAARFVSGLTLFAGAWFLLRTWIMRQRLGSRPVPVLLGISGVATALSGAFGVALAIAAPEPPAVAGPPLVAPPTVLVLNLFWITGKVGFSLAGLALIAAGHRQWRAGGFLRPIAPVSAIIGGAMQLIWAGAAIGAHYLAGPAFVLPETGLVAIGLMLVTGPRRKAIRRPGRGGCFGVMSRPSAPTTPESATAGWPRNRRFSSASP